MTFSTKLELHNILRSRQKRTKAQAQVACTDNFVMDRQTYRHIECSIPHPSQGQSNNNDDYCNDVYILCTRDEM